MALASTIAGDSCLQNFQTVQSPTVWDTGVWNQNQYGIRHVSAGPRVYDNGKTSISGHLDVGPSQANTSIKACANHAGHQGNVEIEARWGSQGFLFHANTTNPDGLLLIATKYDLDLYCGLNIIYFLQTNDKCFR